ncbi:MAG: hypothetical protein GX606_04165 [Elusimicrobia bacterium]|nr:hypothetical protein [Elusimicrobiota bacterium]
MITVSSGKNAFTMIEVIVAAVIVLSTVMVVFATIANTRKPAYDSDMKLKAAVTGRKVLDELRGRVDKEMWEDAAGAWTEGEHQIVDVLGALPDGITGGTYTVTNDGVKGKEVTVTVTY